MNDQYNPNAQTVMPGQHPVSQEQAPAAQTPTSQQGPSTGRRPDYIAYNVTDTKEGKGFFNKIGAAWMHRDGKGYDLALDSVPVSGRVTLREQREQRLESYEQERQAMAQQPAQALEHAQTQDMNRGPSR